MIDEALFIDVNIPMYAAGAPHTNRAACQWVMTSIAKGNLSAVIDVEIVQEIYHRYGSLNDWEIANKMASSLLRIIPDILPVTLRDIQQMVPLAQLYGSAYKIPARDLIHAAVMRNNGLTTIVSTDKHFDLIEGLTRLHPQQLMERER